MTPKPKLNFYDQVKIQSSNPANSALNGEIGVVLGMSPLPDAGGWTYAISIDSKKHAYMFDESELVATGVRFERSDFYDGASVRVRVDERGRGTVVSE
jgi:hypothetical protein